MKTNLLNADQLVNTPANFNFYRVEIKNKSDKSFAASFFYFATTDDYGGTDYHIASDMASEVSFKKEWMAKQYCEQHLTEDIWNNYRNNYKQQILLSRA